MSTVALAPIFNAYQGFSNGGLPLAGGQLFTYQAGTSTLLATYTTAAGSVANTNPIVFGAAGRPAQEIWLVQGSAYRFELYDASLNLIQTFEDIQGSDNSGAAAASAASVLAALADTTSAANGSNLLGYNPALAYTLGVGKFLNYTWARTAAEIAAGVTPVNYQYLPNSVLRQVANTTPGTTNLYAGFVSALATFANYSIPANPTAGGTAATNTGGTIQLEALNYPTSTTIVVPIYSALRGVYPYLGGQGEAGYFGSRIQNNVAGGPAVRLETASVDGIGFYKNAGTQDEGVRIVSQFCSITNSQFDTHKKAIYLSNDVVNDAPAFSHIAYNTFLHQNDPTTASIVANSGGPGVAVSLAGALIECNNFNVSQAEGYIGASSIKMDPAFPVACTIRTNNFQNYSNAAGSANRAALELYMNGGGLVQDNSVSSGQAASAMASGQMGIQIGGGTGNTLSNSRISGWPIGIRLLNTLTGSTIGPSYFSGNTVDILIDAGCAGNTIIVSDPATIITDNSGGLNTIVRTYQGSNDFRTITYSPSITIDARTGGHFVISVTDAVAFAINAPTNPSIGKYINIEWRNTTAGAIANPTWNAVFKRTALTSAGAGLSNVQGFRYDGTFWRQETAAASVVF